MQSSENRQKRILYLPRWYPSRYDPMPGLFIKRHAFSVANYYPVSILYVHLAMEKGISNYEMVVDETSGMLEIIVYFRASNTGIGLLDSLINLFGFFRAHSKGLRYLKNKDQYPDLIHVNVLTRCGFVAWMLKVRRGIPYVITEHWTRYLPGMDNFKGRLRKWISRIVVRNASAVMPVTYNLQLAMERHGLTNDHYKVIPNVVDTDMFKPDFSRSESKEKIILHVSCFDDKQKNISGILKVLQILSIRRKDWRCIMVGEGIHYDKLKNLAQDLGLKDRFVFFTGLRENQELVSLMQQASFQMMFSRYENLPVVIPESFACGVPFLSTNVGGIAEHIHENLGILIPSEDEDALLRSIEYMMDNPGKYDKAAIRQYALDHFSREVIGKQIRGVYEQAMSHPF